MKRTNVSLKTKESIIGTLFMSPWLIGIAVFTLIPFIYSIYLSLCSVEFNADGMKTKFVGFKWFKEIITSDAQFISILPETLKFIILFTIMILVFSVTSAILLNKVVRGRTFFRVLYFFPVVIISGPVMDKLINNNAMSIINYQSYYVYQVIEKLPTVISFSLTYIFSNIVLIMWYAGVQMLIILAGLQKISDILYEAASIDGASSWQKFWKITLPYLRPMILISAIYTVVDLSSMTNTSIYYLIQNNVTNVDKPYSYSAALSWLFTVVILLILGIIYLILRERRYNYS